MIELWQVGADLLPDQVDYERDPERQDGERGLKKSWTPSMARVLVAWNWATGEGESRMGESPVSDVSGQFVPKTRLRFLLSFL